MRNRLRRLAMSTLACTGLTLGLGACEDLLEPEVYDALTPQTFFQSESDFLAAVVALYAPFQTDWSVAGHHPLYNHHTDTYWALSEFTTDELYTWWNSSYRNFQWGIGGAWHTWETIRSVARATDVINQIQNSDAEVSDAVRARYVAEAKTLRAWTMYVLYDFFGPVNVKLDPESLYDTEITPRLSQEEYVSAIVEDLTTAIPNLPDRSVGGDWGRVDKGVARMILLRLHMMNGSWAQAEAAARDIMGMNQYGLMERYADVCAVEQNQELIYAIPAEGGADSKLLPTWYWMEIMPNDFLSAGDVTGPKGWYGYAMPWSHYHDIFQDASDERLTTVLNEYTADWGGGTTGVVGEDDYLRGAIPLKCTQNLGGATGSSNDWPVFRYSEVLLSLAEAINEQDGPTAEALGYANQVRERAGLEPWSDLTQDAFRDSLLAERGRELYSEGVRRQDLIRHGKFVEWAIEKNNATDAQPHHVLFPIPQDVIMEGEGVIAQNCGYSNADANCYSPDNRYQGQ